MQRKRLIYLVAIVALLIAAIPAAVIADSPAAAPNASPLQQGETPDTLVEQAKALEAEQSAPAPDAATAFSIPAGGSYPLFMGVDDITVPAYLMDVTNSATIQAFVGAQVWGSAYDPVSDKVYFNNGSTLYEWPVGGTINALGTIVDPTGATQSMVGLAFYNGTLYGVKNIANEAVYTIDTTTLVATVYIDYIDADFDYGGLAADPNDGTLYGTNDDTTPNGSGLFRINLDGTATLITPYPAGQTDIDGLAVSDDGFAYLVIDEPGFIYVWDFAAGAYAAPLTNPWTSAEVFSGGAYIVQPIGAAISLNKTVGTDPNACAVTDEITVAAGTDVTYCYEVENTGDVTFNLHDLDDSELGNIFSGLNYALTPGASVFVTQTVPINVTTVNTGTWTAYNSSAVEVCSTPNVAIPDDNPSGVSDTLDSTTSGLISDLDVYINTTHTWVGDLIYTLQHVDTGTTVTLIDRPGYTGTGFGCSGDNIDNTVDDEAALSFENNCTPATNPAYIPGEHYQGGDPASSTLMTAFDGEDLSGDWTMTVSDNAGGDTGTLNEWCLVTSGDPVSVQASDVATVTVQGDPPNIYVDPLSMASTQATNTQVQQTLTISNTGGGTLDWTIDEEDTTLPPFVTASSTPDLATASEDVSSVAAPGAPQAAPEKVDLWRAPDAVLWDNGPLVNYPGGGAGGADESRLQNSTLLMTTLGFGHQVLNNNWVADDFTVSDAGGWTVDSAIFFAYQTNSTTTSTMTNVNWILYDGDPSGGGSVIASGSGLSASAWSNIYRTTETTIGVTNRPIMADTVPMGGLFLPAGTYWLAWQTDGSLASGPWAPPITINGQATTGNGLQSIGGTAAFAPALDGGSLTPQGFPFILEGTVGGGAEPCSALSDIPWLSLDTTAGSNAGGTATDVTVTFDSTGLANGVYTGNLCATSNDPDPGPGNETDLVIVPVTLTVQPPTAVALTDLAAGTDQMPAPAGVPLGAVAAAGLSMAMAAGYALRRRRQA